MAYVSMAIAATAGTVLIVAVTRQLVSLNVKVFSWLSQSTFGARILGTGGLLILLRSVRDKQQPSLSDSI